MATSSLAGQRLNAHTRHAYLSARCPAAWTRRRAFVPFASSKDAPVYRKEAATKFVETFVKSGQTLGLGSGELSSLVIEEVGKRVMNGQLTGIQGVPASNAAASEAAFHGVPLHPDPTDLAVDLAFDQVDQLDVENSACILGATGEPQQPQLLRALTIAQLRAAQFVILVESTNLVSRLGGTLPVLIETEGWEQIAEEVDDLTIGDAEVWRRAAPGTVNPDPRGGDNPYVTEDNHHILDLRYDEGLRLFGELEPYSKLEDSLMDIEGVVATGLLLGAASAAVVADPVGPRVIELKEDTTLAEKVLQQSKEQQQQQQAQ